MSDLYFRFSQCQSYAYRDTNRTRCFLPHRVSAKFSSTPNGVGSVQQQQHLLTLEEMQAVRSELLNIQRSLTSGEQEKQELMRSLACLKDDLTR